MFRTVYLNPKLDKKLLCGGVGGCRVKWSKELCICTQMGTKEESGHAWLNIARRLSPKISPKRFLSHRFLSCWARPLSWFESVKGELNSIDNVVDYLNIQSGNLINKTKHALCQECSEASAKFVKFENERWNVVESSDRWKYFCKAAKFSHVYQIYTPVDHFAYNSWFLNRAKICCLRFINHCQLTVWVG